MLVSTCREAFWGQQTNLGFKIVHEVLHDGNEGLELLAVGAALLLDLLLQVRGLLARRFGILQVQF